jgi:hypothetical protein
MLGKLSAPKINLGTFSLKLILVCPLATKVFTVIADIDIAVVPVFAKPDARVLPAVMSSILILFAAILLELVVFQRNVTLPAGIVPPTSIGVLILDVKLLKTGV